MCKHCGFWTHSEFEMRKHHEQGCRRNNREYSHMVPTDSSTDDEPSFVDSPVDSGDFSGGGGDFGGGGASGDF